MFRKSELPRVAFRFGFGASAGTEELTRLQRHAGQVIELLKTLDLYSRVGVGGNPLGYRPERIPLLHRDIRWR